MMSKGKVVAITSNISWFVYNFFRPSILELQRQGYRIVVISTKDTFSDKLEEMGCDFYQLEVDRSGANPLREIRFIVKLYTILRRLRPDYLLNFTPKLNIYGALCGYGLGIKTVNTVAGVGSIFSETGWKSHIGKLMLRVTQPLANHLIFQNDEDRQTYIKAKSATWEKSSRIHGIGVDLSRFQPRCAPDDETVRFILVARMLKSKGVEDFITAAQLALQEAVQLGADIKFALLGFIDPDNPQGISEQTLKEWDAIENISYLGHTDDVPTVLAEYDCLVLPSYYNEGMPQCLIEATAMAKPIITTDNVGCRDIVEHNVNGYLVPVKDSARLAQSMLDMVTIGHEKRVAFGQAGREQAMSKYCHTLIVQHYLDTLASLES